MNEQLTVSDFCQGHGGGRDCTWDPETGECAHGYEHDHGAISYCDGSCPEAREHFYNHMRYRLATLPVASTSVIWLEVSGSGMSYLVSFEGPKAEDRALAYISARKGLVFSEVYDRPFSGHAFKRLDDMLHPTCHHGLQLNNCMDPIGDNHFGTREQELVNGW